MPSGFYVPGPAQIAVGTGASKAMMFLGQSRDGAHVVENLMKRPVHADYAGSEMPADMLIIGKMITVSFRLVRFDPATLAALQARHFLGAVGSIGQNEIGTLLLAESSYFPLMIRSQYQSKTVFNGYLPGIRVLNAFLDQGHSWNLSTVEQEHAMTFMGVTKMDPTTNTGTCWDTTMTGFPAIT